MAKETGIQWCDSTINVQMGCEGCELVKGQKVPKCYAKTLTDRYAGRNGWPESFQTPKIFIERVQKMLSWPDLTGTDRPDKPWLNQLPRIVFLNDMGDTFTKGLPEDWFAEVLPKIANSPHQYLVLTKWPHRFAEFSDRYAVPANVWAGTSITDNKSLARIKHLKSVKASIHWLSIEPLWERLNLTPELLEGIDWVVIGGESGTNPTPCSIDWIYEIVSLCQGLNKAVFVKQYGTHLAKYYGFKDLHGGDWREWSPVMRVRKMPKLPVKCSSTPLLQGT